MTLKIPKITYISIFLIALNMKVLSKSLSGGSLIQQEKSWFQGFFCMSCSTFGQPMDSNVAIHLFLQDRI